MFIKNLPQHFYDFVSDAAPSGVGDTKRKEAPHDEELLDAYSRAVIDVVAKVSPTVAHIHVKKKAAGRPAGRRKWRAAAPAL
jgi:hypothetical protein